MGRRRDSRQRSRRWEDGSVSTAAVASLSAPISWRRATFSSLILPNSDRIASRSLPRSAMSPSSAEMFSILHRHEISHRTLLRSRA